MSQGLGDTEGGWLASLPNGDASSNRGKRAEEALQPNSAGTGTHTVRYPRPAEHTLKVWYALAGIELTQVNQ